MTDHAEYSEADTDRGSRHECLRGEHNRLVQRAVSALTEAARSEVFRSKGSLDFSEFLATVVRSTVANVDSIEHLLGTSPDSREEEMLAAAVRASAQRGRDELLRYRTDPVIVPLNVSLLVEYEWQDASSEEQAKIPLPYGEAYTQAWTRKESLLPFVTERYTAAYRDYAKRFSAAVLAASWDNPDLQGKVVLDVDASPESDWSNDVIVNPVQYDSDPIVWELWTAARAEVGLPSVPPSPASGGKQ